MQVADTVVVVPGGKQPDVATSMCPKTWDKVSYTMQVNPRRGRHMCGTVCSGGIFDGGATGCSGRHVRVAAAASPQCTGAR